MIVPPAIATPCWRPDTIVCTHDRRSSGMITPPGFSFQCGKCPFCVFDWITVDTITSPDCSAEMPSIIAAVGPAANRSTAIRESVE
jgi:hypothetical protein